MGVLTLKFAIASVFFIWLSLTFSTSEALLPTLGLGKLSNVIYKEPSQQPYSKILSEIKISEKDLNKSVSFAKGVINRMKRLETNLAWSDINVKKGSPTKGLYIAHSPDYEAIKRGKDGLIASKATIHLMNTFCNRFTLTPRQCSEFISQYKFKSTSLRNSCKTINKKCTPEEISSQYRTIDGTCNNPNDGSKGESNTAYKRLLHPEYLDGVQEPRRSVTKKTLPSARLVSTSVVKNKYNVDKKLTLAVSQWRQFVEHDLSKTVSSVMVFNGSEIECCSPDGSNLSPRYIHPFCAPIQVPMDDEFYSRHNLNCMTYIRSLTAMRPDCSFGPIDQINQATHFLDGSQIYGSTFEKNQDLRSFQNGKLEVSLKNFKTYLPLSKNPTRDCQFKLEDSSCYKSGDSRVNLLPQVTAMYLIWNREHNRIGDILSRVNPHWNDETVFQEARRIVTAEIQHITYDEWLPVVLGNKYQAKIVKSGRYDENTDPTVGNSFANAALRSLNSLIDDTLQLYNESRIISSFLDMEEHFNKPSVIEKPGYLDKLIRGLSTQHSQKQDIQFADDIRNKLFSNGPYGFDIFSLDIQRGRDHGLPNYNSFRVLCGLPNADQFHDFRDVMNPEAYQSLANVYHSTKDVDLLVGGLLENPYDDSLLGPTLSCLVADQFLRTRKADRYFYKNEQQPKPFTKAQLREIEKITLAKIFCDNSDDIKSMQMNVFKPISPENNLQDCSEIPKLDLSYWSDSH